MSAKDAARQLRYLLAPLDQWRKDPAVDEICLNRPNEIFVRERGQFNRYDVPLDYDDAYDIGVLAGSLNEQNVNNEMPLLSADLPDGERLQLVLPPCVPAGMVSITLRLHEPVVAPLADATKRYSLAKWNRWLERKEIRRADVARLLAAYDSGDIILFFEEAVRLKFNMILCGPTGAGKSTMMKTLLSVIKPNERIITIENALELTIVNQPNHVRLLYSHGDQSASHIKQKDLLEAYLRMRPDRGFVGELRDPNAAYAFLSEVTSGHRGSSSTIHGQDAPQAAARLFNLFKASEEGRSYSDDMVVKQLAMAIDIIVPFGEDTGKYEIREVWLNAEAERRGTGFHELLEKQ